jgi:hypothetical protein
MHQSGHQNPLEKALLPAARDQLGHLKGLSKDLGSDHFGGRGVALLGRALYTASQIIGPDSGMANNDIDQVIAIYRDFLEARGNAVGSERAKADLTGITAFSLGEFRDNGALRSFLDDVYRDSRVGLDTRLPENQRSSETRKLLLHAIDYRPALNQLIVDALDFGDLDEVSIAVGRLDEFAMLLSNGQCTPGSAHGDWVETFADALRQRSEQHTAPCDVINPLNGKAIALVDMASLLELSLR